MPDVRMPDGTVIRNVPAGTTQAQLQAKLQAHAQAQKPTSFWQGVAEGLQKPATNALRAAEYVNPIGMLLRDAQIVKNYVSPPQRNVGDVVANRPAQAQPWSFMPSTVANNIDAQANQLKARSPYRGSTAGHIAGTVVGTAPTMLLPGGPVVQGMAQGGLATEGTTLPQVAKDVALGGMFGYGGDVAGHMAGSVVGGRTVSKAVQLLHDAGVTLTPGQLAGPRSIRQFIEDKALGSLPYINTIPEQAAANSENSLRVAAANRALAPIGESVPAGTAVNSEVIGQLQNKAYDALHNSVGNLNLEMDPDLVRALGSIRQDSPRLVGDAGANQIGANIDHIINMTNQASGPISGQPLRDTLSGIRTAASNADGGVRDQLWNVHDALADALERQNPPEAVNEFTNAREATTLMKRLSSAASKSVDGKFGPTQLLQAARQRGYGTTTDNVANGSARMLDLANAAAEVMRNKSANSGTVPRGIVADVLLGGAGLGAAKISLPAAAAIAPSMLGYVPGVAEVLQRMAINRPQVLKSFGDGIKKAAPLIGDAAVAGGLPLANGGLDALFPYLNTPAQ